MVNFHESSDYTEIDITIWDAGKKPCNLGGFMYISRLLIRYITIVFKGKKRAKITNQPTAAFYERPLGRNPVLERSSVDLVQAGVKPQVSPPMSSMRL